jgi:hypothetical protein
MTPVHLNSSEIGGVVNRSAFQRLYMYYTYLPKGDVRSGKLALACNILHYNTDLMMLIDGVISHCSPSGRDPMSEPLHGPLARLDDFSGRRGLKERRTSKRSKWDGWMKVLHSEKKC